MREDRVDDYRVDDIAAGFGGIWGVEDSFLDVIARLMLRLRANTLWQVDGRHEAAYNKAVV